MKQFDGDSSNNIGKILYGSFFVLILPLLLAFWAWRLDEMLTWAVPQALWLLFSLGITGAILLLGGILGILIKGEGLPMNAYPPKRLVSSGVYALFSHPIYLGAVLLSATFAMIFQSSSGFYLITPLIALMLIALYLGYERGVMERQFGTALANYQPLFSLPVRNNQPVTWLKKSALLLRLILPFSFVIYAIDYARGTGLLLAWQTSNWAAFLALLPFAYIVLRFVLAPHAESVFHYGLAASIMTGLFAYLYLLLPAFGLDLLHPLGLVSMSLLTTILAVNYPFIWSVARLLSEKVANSRHDYLFANGQFRIINHSLFAGLGGLSE